MNPIRKKTDTEIADIYENMVQSTQAKTLMTSIAFATTTLSSDASASMTDSITDSMTVTTSSPTKTPSSSTPSSNTPSSSTTMETTIQSTEPYQTTQETQKQDISNDLTSKSILNIADPVRTEETYKTHSGSLDSMLTDDTSSHTTSTDISHPESQFSLALQKLSKALQSYQLSNEKWLKALRLLVRLVQKSIPDECMSPLVELVQRITTDVVLDSNRTLTTHTTFSELFQHLNAQKERLSSYQQEIINCCQFKENCLYELDMDESFIFAKGTKRLKNAIENIQQYQSNEIMQSTIVTCAKRLVQYWKKTWARPSIDTTIDHLANHQNSFTNLDNQAIIRQIITENVTNRRQSKSGAGKKRQTTHLLEPGEVVHPLRNVARRIGDA